MRFEIEKHRTKLKRISKLSDQDLDIIYVNLLTRINFINEELIPGKIWLESEKLVQDIDIDDIDFVALTKYLKGYLWTGDKALYNGLKEKKFRKIYNTAEMAKRREKAGK